MNKQAIIDQIIAALTGELEGYLLSAKSAQAGATDEQNKAENKYDTRGLEASYLAHGQSQKALDAMQAIQQYRNLPLRTFAATDPIHIGALVELERKGSRTCYFIGPHGGGTEIDCGGKEGLVITPQSPIGSQLMNRKQGEEVSMKIGPSTERYRIVAVT